MAGQRNTSGIQLSASGWLEDHNNAKKELRYKFAKEIAKQNPKSIIDIGCGTGLWLEIFNDVLPKNCKFIGIDLDENSLKEAKKRSMNNDRECEWIALDVNKEPEKIPSADLAFIFNFSSYIEDISAFLNQLTPEKGFKKIVIRQFLGDEIKFGPFNTHTQTNIDSSIKASMDGSKQIKYFDLDRLMNAVQKSNRKVVFQDFELFKAFSPFSDNAFPYIKGTAEWTAERVPDNERKAINKWIKKAEAKKDLLYFFSIDWLSILS
ncbi:class I SAM-dependent methyltransferase [Furfurilactobacillus rossiae]|uniref:Methyltransferase type 12 domain-containing protein n=1 Tax=Furfurilactobacillus rossiae DSM 15814 TaxID=1114972 RepID=A0A0R1RHK4_9LACO|nr:class I SAM-dependent methyltransferase [Furfurilactobacillus rossiae]KRL52904.1 hypothetical protein FD35_GL001800 [Furfurilactobacillus rossiae DSM 15814]QFR65619.1 methyltransferase domain-containing protein [Furfurilactobacillus rossiae]QFR68012.1 methyltransferase domain-containing protein [Furfurilactobacillus rossiae]QLE61007.1 Methyltransferase type 12 [Furfurilactobacillus rossiae]